MRNATTSPGAVITMVMFIVKIVLIGGCIAFLRGGSAIRVTLASTVYMLVVAVLITCAIRVNGNNYNIMYRTIQNYNNMTNTIPNRTQRLSSYVSGAGLTVYQIEQYKAALNDWFIVGDVSLNKDLVQALIDNHNMKLKLNI